jgi:hypothetical protein
VYRRNETGNRCCALIHNVLLMKETCVQYVEWQDWAYGIVSHLWRKHGGEWRGNACRGNTCLDVLRASNGDMKCEDACKVLGKSVYGWRCEILATAVLFSITKRNGYWIKTTVSVHWKGNEMRCLQSDECRMMELCLWERTTSNPTKEEVPGIQ